jgi:uroporphyrin-3 C-methyltransferase/uroporphyrinogen III methyltransferase/synthase
MNDCGTSQSRAGADPAADASFLRQGREGNSYPLRENLKLRLLNARLDLLARNEAGFREDLRVSQAWVQRYFDARSKAGQAAIAQLKQLSATSISIELPSLAESLEAVRGFKTRRDPERRPK